MNLGYVRVSSASQHEERQVEALEKYGIEKWFKEKVSGKDMNREQLQAMLDYMREGDTVYVMDFSRLARSTRDLLDIVDMMKKKGVKLVSVKENLDSSTPTGQLMLTMLGAIAEFERQTILDRQAEGIAIAKKKGVYKGRARITVDKVKGFSACYRDYLNRDISKRQMAMKLHISRPTLDRLIAEQKKKDRALDAEIEAQKAANIAKEEKDAGILEQTGQKS